MTSKQFESPVKKKYTAVRQNVYTRRSMIVEAKDNIDPF